MSKPLEPISDGALSTVSGGWGFAGWSVFFYNLRKARERREQEKGTPPPPGPPPVPQSGSGG